MRKSFIALAALVTGVSCGLAFVLTGAPSAAPGSGSPAPGPVELVASDPSGTTLRVTAGAPRLVAPADAAGEPVGAGKEAAAIGVRVDLDGFPSLSPPGAPDLPGLTVLIAVPAGAAPALQVTLGPEQEIAGVRVAPAPTPGPRPAPGEPPTWIAEPDPALYARAYPEARVTLSPVQQMGELDVVAVTVRPAVFDPEREVLRVAERIEVRIVTAGGDVRRAAEGIAPAAASAVLNGEAARTFARPRTAAGAARGRAPLGARQGASFESSTHWVKVSVAVRGLVRVDGARLAAAGVDLSAIDPATLRVFWGGGLDPEPGVSPRSALAPEFMTECAIEIEGGADQSFAAEDAVLFFGQGASGWRDDFRGGPYALDYVENQRLRNGLYWLTWGGDFPDPPRRIASRTAAPAGAPVVDRGRARIHNERNRRYLSDLYEPGQKWERWFETTFVDRDAAASYTVRPQKADLAVPGSLRLRLWGYTSMGSLLSSPPIRDHYARAWFNGVPILTAAGADTFIWDGPRFQLSGRQDIVSNSLALVDGDNRIQMDVLTVVDPQKPQRSDQVMFAWYDFGYARRLDLTGESGGEVVPAGDPGPATVQITGAPAGARVLDVSDPTAPVDLTGVEWSGTTLRYLANLDPAVPAKFLVGAAAAAPAAVEVDQSQPHLRRAGNAAWYVVIAHDSMIQEAVRLAEAHRRVPPPEGAPDGMPLAVRASDVYDEFGWGLKSEIAIRNFVDYAFHTWAAPPRYVCLLGDASYDPKDFYGDGTRETDLIPAPQFWNWIGGEYGGSDYVSDDYYVRTFGTELETPPDRLTDLHVGRLPAGSRDEAQVLVDSKMVPFLEDPPFGPWRQQAILLADDEIAGDPPRLEGFYHVANSEEVAQLLPPELDIEKIYLPDYPCEPCTYPRAKPAARDAFIAAFDAGAAIVNYIGHGSPIVLAHESVFKIENVGQLANDGRLPFFSTFSCTVNRFDEPSSEGIGEALVTHPGGGSAASVGATDLAFISSNQVLNLGTYERLFPGRDLLAPQSFGRAFGDAKNALAAYDTAGARKYVLLGDPALAPSTPGRRLALSFPGATARGDTSVLVAGVPYALKAHPVDFAPPGSWLGQFEGRDSYPLVTHGVPQSGVTYYVPGHPFFRSTLTVTGDTLSAQIIVPIDAAQSLSPGRGAGEARIYASGNAWDGVGQSALFLDVEGGEPIEPETDGGPEVAAEFDAPSPSAVPPNALLTIRLEDKSGINVVGNTPSNSAYMRIDEALTVELNERFVYEPGSATTGTIEVALPDLAAGPHSLTIVASDNYLNRTEAEVPFAVIQGGTMAIREAGLYPNPFDLEAGQGTVLSFAVPEPAEVEVKIFTVSGKLIREYFPEIAAPVPPGIQQVFWDGRDEEGDKVANGVYLCAVSARGTVSGVRDEVVLRSVVRR